MCVSNVFLNFFRRKIGPFVSPSWGTPWPIFSISSISDPGSFRKAMFCYQKIRRKILPRLQHELAARPYAHSSFVDGQKTCRTYVPIWYNTSNVILSIYTKKKSLVLINVFLIVETKFIFENILINHYTIKIE
jgi:hypothetical protein